MEVGTPRGRAAVGGMGRPEGSWLRATLRLPRQSEPRRDGGCRPSTAVPEPSRPRSLDAGLSPSASASRPSRGRVTARVGGSRLCDAWEPGADSGAWRLEEETVRTFLPMRCLWVPTAIRAGSLKRNLKGSPDTQTETLSCLFKSLSLSLFFLTGTKNGPLFSGPFIKRWPCGLFCH